MTRNLLALLLAIWSFAASAVEFNEAQRGEITQVVGQLLSQFHYLQVPLNDEMSGRFLKIYLDSLDSSHMMFNQEDVDFFTSKYGNELDDRTKRGDASPGYEIFKRYLQRLDQRTELAQRLLREPMDFSKDESFIPVRNKLPWPKDETEMESLWRARIKYEVLADRLDFEGKLDKAKKEKKDAKTDAKESKTDEGKPSVPLKYNPEEGRKKIAKRYESNAKFWHELDSSEILQVYLTSLGHAYDPHSDYMAPEEATNFDIKSVSLSLTGIGASLTLNEDRLTKVEQIIPGGPADLSKLLKPGDLIVAVAQGNQEPKDVEGAKLSSVVNLIRGEAGTVVKLTLIPAKSVDHSERKVIAITRAKVELKESHAKARVIDHLDEQGVSRRLGYIDLPQFYQDCANDVAKLVNRLKKEQVTGLILDLRRNGGGLLPEAVKLAGLFVPEGPVVQVKSSKQQVEVLDDSDSTMMYDGPLVVMVSHLSASASEIVAAALQDYGRALIVGDQTTHGKGTVQTLFPLSNAQPLKRMFDRDGVDPGKMKFTVQKFYRIAGGTTQKNGVTPDVMLPSIWDYLEMGEAKLPYCLESDRIAAAPYKAYDLAKPFAADLQKRAGERISNDQDFKYLNEDIELTKKRMEDKSVSLNLEKRLTEKHELDARDNARKQERAGRKPSPDKVFELSLDNVEKNQPITPYAPNKDKDLIAQAAGDDDPDSEVEAARDPHLDETLRILTDYAARLDKAGLKATAPHLVIAR